MSRFLSVALAASMAFGSMVPGAGAAQAVELQEIRVRPGDTLWSIAQKYLKDPKRWNVILRYNRLPTSDPTVALPGMVLRVPKAEIKAELRAATLIQVRRRVMHRRRGKAAWQTSARGLELLNGDGLRTMERSWARVKFFGGSVLSLDPNSMAILKAPRPDNRFLQLNRGAAHATVARIVTPSARVVPSSKGTKYTARVMEDLSTRVQVFQGTADVQDSKGRKTIKVRAGFYTDVKLDQLPITPIKMPKFDASMTPELEALGQGVGESLVRVRRGAGPARATGAIAEEVRRVSVGVPVAAYHIRVARDRGFDRIVLDKSYDAFESIDLSSEGLREGSYWVQISITDLLGERSKWSKPKPYTLGSDDDFNSVAFDANLNIMRPEKAYVKTGVPRYRIVGRTDPGLSLSINGRKIPLDEDGYFSYEVRLRRGRNQFDFRVFNSRGSEKTIKRIVEFQP